MAKEVKPAERLPRNPSGTPGRPAGRRQRTLWVALYIAVPLMLYGGWSLFFRSPDRVGQSAVHFTLPDLQARSPALKEPLASAITRVNQNPGDVKSLATLGRLFHANRYLREAAACWNQLNVIDPTDGHWSYYLSDLNRLRGTSDTLEADLERVRKIAPDYAPAALQLADYEFKQGHLEQAYKHYEERLALVPDDAYATLGLARIALAKKQEKLAETLLASLVRDHPEFTSAHNVYAEFLARNGDESGVQEQRRLGATSGRFRSAPDPWLEELRPYCFDAEQLIQWADGDLQTRHGDYGHALFLRAIELAPENVEAYQRLGECYSALNLPAKAVEVFARGAQLEHASELLFSNWCDACNALKSPSAELKAAEAGLQRFPQASVLHNARAHALEGLDKIDSAIAEYQKSIELAPWAADPHANLGYLFVRLQRYDDAERELVAALRLQPSQVKATTLLTQLKIEQEDFDAAERLISTLHASDVDQSAVQSLYISLYMGRAAVAFKDNDPARVEALCRQGLAKAPRSPELNGLLGALYIQQERFSEARTVLAVAHAGSPDDPRVTLSLGQALLGLGRREEARQWLTDAARQARNINEEALAARCDELLAKLQRTD